MPETKGSSVYNCPIDLGVCYPSCYWWKDGKCTYPKRDRRSEKQIHDLKAMRR